MSYPESQIEDVCRELRLSAYRLEVVADHPDLDYRRVVLRALNSRLHQHAAPLAEVGDENFRSIDEEIKGSNL